MSERKPSVEELLQRIDDLLTVLNIISKDLMQLSEGLKESSFQKVVQRDRVQAIEEVRTLFTKNLVEMLEFEEADKDVIIRPRGYLGAETFAKIATIIRDVGGEYVSAGKESHFRVSKNE